MVQVVTDKVKAMLDRSDPLVKARQDLAVHAAFFAGAIFAIHRWGHKLAV